MNQPTTRQRRVGVAEAKAGLSGILREIDQGPLVVHSRGRDLAVLVSVAVWERLTGEHARGSAVTAWLAELSILKQQHQGGVDDFAPEPASFDARSPFSRRK